MASDSNVASEVVSFPSVDDRTVESLILIHLTVSR
jgi:hypothetical protein